MACTDINSEDRLVQATFAEHLEDGAGMGEKDEGQTIIESRPASFRAGKIPLARFPGNRSPKLPHAWAAFLEHFSLKAEVER